MAPCIGTGKSGICGKTRCREEDGGAETPGQDVSVTLDAAAIGREDGRIGE